MRPALACVFAMEVRLSSIIARMTEPMLAQMRLAWWRDQLACPVQARPRGDAVLDALGSHWAGAEHRIAALVDGWEVWTKPDHSVDDVGIFLEGYAAPFGTLAANCLPGIDARAGAVNGQWYGAGIAFLMEQRLCGGTRVLDLAPTLSERTRMPRKLRSLSIAGGLGQRVVLNRRGPLFGDRGSALAAVRLGLFG